MTGPRQNIKSFSLDELTARFAEHGMKKYRAVQVFEWIYKQRVSSFDEMTNISKSDRDEFSTKFYISSPRTIRKEISEDSTVKFLFELEDRNSIESVLIPDDDRLTLCISSQVGCAQSCRFCLTGAGGFRRNLAAYEITDQILSVENALAEADGNQGSPPQEPGRKGDRPRMITNIVFMGMGEPLANMTEVTRALTCMTSDRGLAFAPRRITLSTAGLVPEIERLGLSGPKVNLAVSLNATTDEIRNMLMPVNKRYPIRKLLAACKRYPLEPRRRITFEYVLLGGVNDSRGDALRLTTLLTGIPCKINLIPFNPFPESGFLRPDEASVQQFKKILQEKNYTALVRNSRGRDISAACGLLRAAALHSELKA